MTDHIEKIEAINNLIRNRKKTLETLNIIKRGAIATGDNVKKEKINTFRHFSISADICTGSDYSTSRGELSDNAFLQKIAATLAPLFEEELKLIDEELDSRLK